MKKEIWLPVVGYEGYYEVSDMGNIRNARSKRVRAISHTRQYSHLLLSVGGKHTTKRVHRLVAEAFLPRIEGKPHINHKNGNKNDNRVENLEWVSQAENNLHAYRTLHKKPPMSGHIPPNRKIRDTDIEFMDLLNRRGMPTDTIGEKYGVCGSTIRKHLRRYRNDK